MPLALISLYSPPNKNLLQLSSEVVYSCQYRGEDSLRVVSVTAIQAVVAMVPHTIDEENCFFMFEQPGMDVAYRGGFLVDENEELEEQLG